MLVDALKPKAGSGQDKVGSAELCHTDVALMRRKKPLQALALGIERIGLVSLPCLLAFSLVSSLPLFPPLSREFGSALSGAISEGRWLMISFRRVSTPSFPASP